MGIFGAVFGLFTGVVKLFDYYKGAGISEQNRINSLGSNNDIYYDIHGTQRYTKTKEPVIRMRQNFFGDDVLMNAKTGEIIKNYSEDNRINVTGSEKIRKEKAIENNEPFYISQNYQISKDLDLSKNVRSNNKGRVIVRNTKTDKPYLLFYRRYNFNQQDINKYFVYGIDFKLYVDVSSGDIEYMYVHWISYKEKKDELCTILNEKIEQIISDAKETYKKINEETKQLYNEGYDWGSGSYSSKLFTSINEYHERI